MDGWMDEWMREMALKLSEDAIVIH